MPIPAPPDGSLPPPPKRDNRQLLLLTVGTMGALMFAVMLLFPQGHDDLKVSTFDVTNRPTLGTGNGAQIVVFSDYQCPACKVFNDTQLPILKRELIGTGRATLTEMHTPIFQEPSTQAAISAECVYRQSKEEYWNYTDRLFSIQGQEGQWVTPERLASVLPSGIDRAAYANCLSDPTAAAQIKADTRQHEKAGLRGTPTVFVNGKRAKDFSAKTILGMIDDGSAAPESETTSN